MPAHNDEERFEAKFSSTPSDQTMGIGALAGAFVLYPSIGQWPTEFYDFARWVTFLLSFVIAYWALRRGRRGWAIFAGLGALLFNPLLPMLGNNGWDVAGLAYGTAYGLLGIGSTQPKIAGIVVGVFGTCAAVAFTLTFYVNYYMPRGPQYPSGDIVCMNDGRGPCGEEMLEDTSNLNIPNWATFLRKNIIWTFFFFGAGTVLSFAKSREDH